MPGAGRPFDDDFVGEVPRRAKARTRHEKKMARFAAAQAARPFRHVALAAEVAVRAPLFDTEERAKVEGAMRALFPDIEFDEAAGAGEVAGRARDLARFAEILRHSRIRDTAREVLKDAVGEDRVIRLALNKQAATAARVNFVGPGAVLGAIEVEMRAEEPIALAEELTWIEGESDERLFGTKLHTLPPKRVRRA